MADEPLVITRPKAWLVARAGALAGARYALREGVTRIGRNPENDVVIKGPEAAVVSLYHAEIVNDGEACRIRDLSSTNGTYLNGERIGEARLAPQSSVQFGKSGPEFAFVVSESGPEDLESTLVAPEGITQPAPPPAVPQLGSEAILSEAVMRARQARALGAGGQTMTLVREAMRHALRHSARRLRFLSAALAVALIGVSGYGYWRFAELRREKTAIDRRIQTLEKRIEAAAADPSQTERLISELAAYQNQATSLQRSLFYRLGARQQQEPPGTRDIRSLMSEFGAETYSIPPEFAERVEHYIRQYQGPDRPLMTAALDQYRGKIEIMRRVLQQESLPPDMAYIPLVESALKAKEVSSAGAAGPWQFTPATARAFGLRVGQDDQRYNLVLSTRAACRYLRDLILDFGAGSSVMLALAAYNLGPSKVKEAIVRNVKDPIQQRNFWYLYRARAIPEETREYVPKVFAAIIIGRDPEKYGF